MRRTPALALVSAAVALAVGGTTAFVTLDKTVSLSVDGHARDVRGFSRTVGDVLQSAGVRVGPHDSVRPAAGTAVHEGTRITFRHGRPLALSLDGQESRTWTLEATVAGALTTMGVATGGAYLSAPLSADVPLAGMTLVVRRPQRLTILADGHVHPVTTTAATVGEAFRTARVALLPTDRTSVALTAYPRGGMVVAVTRVRGVQQRVGEPLAFGTVRRADASLYKGSTRVAQAGRVGARVSVYQLTYVNWRLVARRLVARSVPVAPLARVLLVGTKPRPVLRWTGGGSGGPNWAALARCESGGNPRAISRTGKYRGLYQFSFSTWRSVGGSGDPAAASPAEQTYRASLLYARSGRAPWPVCGRYL